MEETDVRLSTSRTGGHKQTAEQVTQTPLSSTTGAPVRFLYSHLFAWRNDQGVGGKNPTLVLGWIDSIQGDKLKMDSGCTERQ